MNQRDKHYDVSVSLIIDTLAQKCALIFILVENLALN